MPEITSALLERATTRVAVESGRPILQGQRTRLIGGVAVKADNSLLSRDDTPIEERGKATWRDMTGLPMLGEETGMSDGDSEVQSSVVGMQDPIDGTRPYANGAHSSVSMAGAYDLAQRRFLAASIMHPTSGTLTRASDGQTRVSEVKYNDHNQGFATTNTRNVNVWDGLLKGATVLIDNLAPFSRNEGKRVITTRCHILGFLGELLDVGAVPQCYGSNGYHQMLVAKGGEKERLAGAVMLSQGGPWDAIGLPAVENAGGMARAFQVLENGRIDERDPHDPFNWDLLVLGNNQTTTDTISGALERVYDQGRRI